MASGTLTLLSSHCVQIVLRFTLSSETLGPSNKSVLAHGMHVPASVAGEIDSIASKSQTKNRVKNSGNRAYLTQQQRPTQIGFTNAPFPAENRPKRTRLPCPPALPARPVPSGCSCYQRPSHQRTRRWGLGEKVSRLFPTPELQRSRASSRCCWLYDEGRLGCQRSSGLSHSFGRCSRQRGGSSNALHCEENRRRVYVCSPRLFYSSPCRDASGAAGKTVVSRSPG